MREKLTVKRREKINQMCDEILEKDDLAPMTVNQHIAVWGVWLALFGLGTGAMSIHFIIFRYSFIVIIAGLLVITFILWGGRRKVDEEDLDDS